MGRMGRRSPIRPIIIGTMWTETSIDGRPIWTQLPERPTHGLIFIPDADGINLLADALPPDWACVVPTHDDPWWSDRGTRSAERHFLEAVVPFLPGDVALLGVGAGGQAALRLGFKHPKRFPAVASLVGAIDHYELHGRGTILDDLYPTREHCRQDGAIMHVHPANWPPHVLFDCPPESPWHRGNDRLHEKLMALGVPHRSDLASPACGHTTEYVGRRLPATLRFLAEGVERQSRRLL